MSVGFAFTAPVNRETFGQALDRAAEKWGCGVLRDGGVIQAEFCPGGGLYMKLEEQAGETILSGECCTSVVGPGFHAAAIGFVDTLAAEAGLALDMDDETGYYRDRDFGGMRERYFDRRLKMLVDICMAKSREEGLNSLCLNWSADQYKPARIDGTVVTPMGRFSLEGLQRRFREAGVESFAREYYLWNEPERDARFYRNLALTLLWEQCSFMPGSRSEEDEGINNEVVRLLERALSMDRTLPFPKEEYLLICGLDGRAPVDLSGVPDYESEFRIGYRRDTVTWRLGNLDVSIDGSFLFSYDDSSGHGDYVWYDGLDTDWHTVRMTAFQSNEPAAFRPGAFEGLFPEEFEAGDGLCRAAWAGLAEENGEAWEDVVAQVICGGQITFITVSCQRPEGREWAFSLLRGLRAYEAL